MGMRDTPGAYTRGACEVVQIQLTYLATPPAPSFEMDGMIKHETPPSNNIPRVEFFRPNFLQKTTASTVPGNSIMATKAKSLYTSPSRSDDPDQAIKSSVRGGAFQAGLSGHFEWPVICICRFLFAMSFGFQLNQGIAHIREIISIFYSERQQ